MQIIKPTKLNWKKHSENQRPKDGRIVFLVTKSDQCDELSPFLFHKETAEDLDLPSKKLLLKPVVYFGEDVFTDLFKSEDLYWDWEREELDETLDLRHSPDGLNPDATYFAEIDTQLNWEEMDKHISDSRLEMQKLNTLFKDNRPEDATIAAIFLTKGLVPIVEWDSEQFVYS